LEFELIKREKEEEKNMVYTHWCNDLDLKKLSKKFPKRNSLKTE